MDVEEGFRQKTGPLVDQLSSWQFRQWAEYFEVEPFGENQKALQSALLIMLINNLWSESKIRRLSQVFPWLEDKPEDPEVLEMRLASWARAQNRRAEQEEAEEEVVHDISLKPLEQQEVVNGG